MRKCNACHRSTFDSAKFCHHCGAKMIKETLDCPECNHANSVNAKFCESCGYDFFPPIQTPVSPPKKRSIFDDIEEEIEESKSEAVEEKLDLNVNESISKEEVVIESLEEEELELIFTKTTEESEIPENKIEEEEEESLDFTFEKTPAEVEKSTINKADIPFEIVENLPDPEDIFLEEIPEISSESVTEESIFEEIIHEKEQEIEAQEEIEELDLETPPINDLFEENPNHNIEEEIFQKFATAFENQIKTEQNAAQYNAYVDRFEESDFKLSFEFRVKQLAEEVQKIRQDQSILKDEASLLNQAFTELIDYFIIRYCDDLNQIKLSEKILQYQNIAPENIDLSTLILDYLNFEEEDERVDFDFIKMPIKRLQNASKSFLFPEKGEKIFFICDQSILGSGKEGFAMTEKAIYWKMQFETAERVYYKNLQSIEPQKDWININEMFFNANPSLNIKLMKLLKKLKWVISA